ncbi:hypothetical protein Tco_1452056 [Tanacetum coccineum]
MVIWILVPKSVERASVLHQPDGVGSQRHHIVPIGELNGVSIALMARFDKQTKRVSTPHTSQFKITAAMSPKDDAERAYIEKVPYANAVSSLMYAMICTRPDISHVVGIVSRYMHNHGKGHWQAVKWIVDVGLVFEHGSYVFTLAKATVSWNSTLQSSIALSTTEAEYMAMTKAVKEAN